MIYILFGAAIIVGISYLALMYLDRCPHQWVEVESGNLLRGGLRREVGGYKVYQCEHCKKFKTETWRIDRA